MWRIPYHDSTPAHAMHTFRVCRGVCTRKTRVSADAGIHVRVHRIDPGLMFCVLTHTAAVPCVCSCVCHVCSRALPPLVMELNALTRFDSIGRKLNEQVLQRGIAVEQQLDAAKRAKREGQRQWRACTAHGHSDTGTHTTPDAACMRCDAMET